MNNRMLPYKIFALGPFAPVPEEKFKPSFVQVDIYSIDDAMEKIAPALYIPLPLDKCSEGALTLKFHRIKDFKPESIIKNNSYLKSTSLKQKSSPVPPKKSGLTEPGKEEKSKIDDILSMVETAEPSPDTSLEKNQTNFDRDVIIREIFSNMEFQKTESAWRGLQNLVKKGDIKGFQNISLSISSVSHQSLENTLNVIESLPHDEIPNLILIDLGFDNTMPSIELLEKIADFADKMLLPVCVWLKPDFFRIESWNQLAKIPYIKNHLDDAAYAKFRKLKTLPGASWLIVSCNGFTLRPAHEFENNQALVSPVWGMGILCAKALNQGGWPMGFTKYNTCIIDDLTMFSYDGKNMVSTEALFSEDRIMQLIEAGITPIVGAKNKDFSLIPKETSLSGDSIKFQMFINRIIESLIDIKEKNIAEDGYPENSIISALKNIFIQTGHNPPEDVSVIYNGNTPKGKKVFIVSFIPPESVITSSGKTEFSFIW